jgi:Uma2 family endonuclease
MRVKVSQTGKYTYPDLSIVCGTPQFDDEHKETLLNPKVIIEILSSSTENYDKSEKFKQYWTIKSLSDYILIVQNEHQVQHFVRYADNLWQVSRATHLNELIRIASIDCEITVEEIYEKVDSLI